MLNNSDKKQGSDLACNFAEQMQKKTKNTGENLDLSIEGDTKNLILYLILKEREKFRNMIQAIHFRD